MLHGLRLIVDKANGEKDDMEYTIIPLDANCGNGKQADIKKSERKRRTQSAEVAIKAVFDESEIIEYIIVSDETDANEAEKVFYLSDTGKELLSAAYAKQRRKKGSLGGRRYR